MTNPLRTACAHPRGRERRREALAPKSQGDRMKTCVFFGEPGGTGEHIISTAVQKRMQLSGVEIIGVREANTAPCARRRYFSSA